MGIWMNTIFKMNLCSPWAWTTYGSMFIGLSLDPEILRLRRDHCSEMLMWVKQILDPYNQYQRILVSSFDLLFPNIFWPWMLSSLLFEYPLHHLSTSINSFMQKVAMQLHPCIPAGHNNMFVSTHLQDLQGMKRCPIQWWQGFECGGHQMNKVPAWCLEGNGLPAILSSTLIFLPFHDIAPGAE